MKKTKEVKVQQWFLRGAFALALALFLGLFVNGFSEVAFAAQQGTVTSSGGAKVRKEATRDSDMVGSAAQNQKVTINSSVQGSDGYTWYQVTVGSVTGYIRSDLVEVSEGGEVPSTEDPATAPAEVTAVNPVSATVKGADARIRDSASTNGQIVETVADGLVLTVTGQVSDSEGMKWYQVNYSSDGNSVEGFIREDYVDLAGELTPYTEEPTEPVESEEPSQPAESQPYDVVLQDGEWYLFVAETQKGYVIQDLFDQMEKNVEEYNKLEKTESMEKIVIIILVILLVAAITGVVLLFLRMKDMSDNEYFSEVEKETLRRRSASSGQGGQKVMQTVGGGKGTGPRPAGSPQGRGSAGTQQGSRAAGSGQGARPAGARPAGPSQGQTARPNGARPAGPSQGQTARPNGARPMGAGARPAGARPTGARPMGAGARPVGARPAGAGQGAGGQRASQEGQQDGWKSKNFVDENDNDEFEFEFLNGDEDGEN